jgi:hypothetical protein
MTASVEIPCSDSDFVQTGKKVSMKIILIQSGQLGQDDLKIEFLSV